MQDILKGIDELEWLVIDISPSGTMVSPLIEFVLNRMNVGDISTNSLSSSSSLSSSICVGLSTWMRDGLSSGKDFLVV